MSFKLNVQLVIFCMASMTVKEVGLSDYVLESLAQCFSRRPSEVKVQISPSLPLCSASLSNFII